MEYPGNLRDQNTPRAWVARTWSDAAVNRTKAGDLIESVSFTVSIPEARTCVSEGSGSHRRELFKR
jgi:hypothetical protein